MLRNIRNYNWLCQDGSVVKQGTHNSKCVSRWFHLTAAYGQKSPHRPMTLEGVFDGDWLMIDSSREDTATAVAFQQQVTREFARRFSSAPAFAVPTPGSVNLIGVHTGYNDGFVLPMATDRATWIALRPRDRWTRTDLSVIRDKRFL